MANGRTTPSRESSRDDAWLQQVEDAVGAELHRIATEETGDTVQSRSLRMWAKRYALGGQLRSFAREIAQAAAMEPTVAGKLQASPPQVPTSAEVQAAVSNVIALVGSPGRA